MQVSVSPAGLFPAAHKGLSFSVTSKEILEFEKGAGSMGLERRDRVRLFAVAAEEPAQLAGSRRCAVCPHSLPGVFAGLSMLRNPSSMRTRQPAVRSLSGGESQAWRRMRNG